MKERSQADRLARNYFDPSFFDKMSHLEVLLYMRELSLYNAKRFGLVGK